jgi:hypothetical protein
MSKPSLVVTSIAAPNAVLRSLAAGSLEHGYNFFVIGDVPSPPGFQIDGCEFYSLDRQSASGLTFAALCPTRHYARKNIGYLLAIREGTGLIVETDDDNFPHDGFWSARARRQTAPTSSNANWVNVYSYFSDANIWPRGLPLDAVTAAPRPYSELETRTLDCPIQQGLADENPDVDAIYRLILPLPQNFLAGRSIILAAGSYSPFNSQNTAWWPDAFPLLYLPAHCSFRMTDIWRSFVAQRIAYENGWGILYHAPTVHQERNDHRLMRDFADEVPGYLHNRAIMDTLAALPLKSGAAHMADNLRRCYQALVENRWVGEMELALLDAWLADLAELTRMAPATP